jgi:hypothetical protein
MSENPITRRSATALAAALAATVVAAIAAFGGLQHWRYQAQASTSFQQPASAVTSAQMPEEDD